jgi:hypothetical protein
LCIFKERWRWRIQQDSLGLPEVTGGHPTKLYQLRYIIQKLFSIWRLDPLGLDRPVKLVGCYFAKQRRFFFAEKLFLSLYNYYTIKLG